MRYGYFDNEKREYVITMRGDTALRNQVQTAEF